MKLDTIIHQLSDDNYNALVNQLKASRSDKYLYLTKAYREGKLSDKELIHSLNIKNAGFYTLKSRLYDKVQEFLYQTTDSHLELQKNISNLTHLINNNPRETAIEILKKLEIQLIEHDMPYELISVYKALKKLHVYSSKYYDYEQLYNKFVAFNLAQDKAEEILTSFCKTLSTFYASRDSRLLDILLLYKNEIAHLTKIYSSHRILIYQNILNIHFSIYFPDSKESKNDPSIEELLKESFLITKSHSKDTIYTYLTLVLEFLSFQYYNNLKLHKNAALYYNKIKSNLQSLQYLKHSCFASHIFLSSIEHQMSTIIQTEEEKKIEFPIISLDQMDFCSTILLTLSKASKSFFLKEYNQAITYLNDLLMDHSFKNFSFIEIEIKLFIGLLSLLANKFDQAESVLRSVSRKLIDDVDQNYNTSLLLFLKFLKTSASSKEINKYEKLYETFKLFNTVNIGPFKILSYIKIDAQTIRMLSL